MDPTSLHRSERFSDVDVEVRLSVQSKIQSSAAGGRDESDSDWSSTAEVSSTATGAPDVPVVLDRFPGHMAVLCQSEYFDSQYAVACLSPVQKVQLTCTADTACQTPGKPVLTLTVDDVHHLPAATAVIAALYGVRDAISILKQSQLAHAVKYARMLQLESVARKLQQMVNPPVAKDVTAIGLFLQHYGDRLSQRFICCVAQVCKEWNTAVQQANIGSLCIRYHASLPAVIVDDSDSAHRLDDTLLSLATWLPKYGRLVHGICIKDGGFDDPQHFRDVAGPLLQFSLQAAAGQGLQLRSFYSDVLNSSTFLRALPCASLTRLEIAVHDGASLATVLPRLEHLQRLWLVGPLSQEEALPLWDLAACLPGLNKLGKLTSLAVHDTRPFDTRQLPTQLLGLTLGLWHSRQPQLVDLANLTHLTRVKIFGYDGVPGSALPRQIRNLDIDILSGVMSGTDACLLDCLGQLEFLKIHLFRETTTELVQLAKLPRLQKMSLRYAHTEVSDGLDAYGSSVWPQIQQLQELRFWSIAEIPVTQLHVALGSIAACTGLTRLDLFFDTEEPAQVPVDLCRCISGLQHLQELHALVTEAVAYWSGQARHLRPLTGLTKLGLYLRSTDLEEDWKCSDSERSDQSDPDSEGESCDEDSEIGSSDIVVLSDAAINASLLQLKRLQWLSLPVRSIAVLPVIGSLRDLRYLNVRDLPLEADDSDGLMRLCDLKQLTKLRGFERCTEDVKSQFWDAVHS